jgi:hypothetical protein
MDRISELDVGDGAYTEDLRDLLLRAVDNMTDSKAQPKLENWILVNFCEIYNRSRSEKFEWVERGNPPAPDFRIFKETSATPTLVEVTELLDPGRKRREEYKSAFRRAQQTGQYAAVTDVPDPSPSYERALIAHARMLFEQKFSKPYPDGTWLVIYFNPTLFTVLYEDTLSFASRVIQAAVDSISPPTRIHQVWVLTNDLRIARLRIIQ